MSHRASVRRFPTVTRQAALAAIPQARKVDAFQYLLGVGHNPKTAKSDKGGVYLTAIMYLAPGRTCPWASPGCLKGCLNTAGVEFQLAGKLKARKARTDLFYSQPAVFMALLVLELRKHVRKCERRGVRLDRAHHAHRPEQLVARLEEAGRFSFILQPAEINQMVGEGRATQRRVLEQAQRQSGVSMSVERLRNLAKGVSEMQVTTSAATMPGSFLACVIRATAASISAGTGPSTTFTQAKGSPS